MAPLDATHISIGDEGDHFTLAEATDVASKPAAGDEIVVRAGGGELIMEIDKCTGAVSHVRFNR